MFLIPLILVYYLRDDAGISVNAAKQRVKSEELQKEEQRGEVIGMVVPVEEVGGEQQRWGLNDDEGQDKRVDR